MPDPMILNNRYQLEKTLGSGGMAVVYQARDLMLERSVAIKVLREDYSRDADFRENFRQEARAAANLSHPNIVTVHDFGLDSGRLFIVMEYVPGTDLKSILQERGRLPIAEALALSVQACSGVGYAHRAGLVHCDLKPQNMLITPDRRLKVTDFGIARALATIHPEEKSEIVWGSPQYFSPEQAAGVAPSPSSDVYSLGIMLYELLTGKPPFSASSSTELARLHREAAPVPPRQLNPAIPAELEQVLLKVLSKEPSARYRTADQFGRVLMTIQNQLENPVLPVPLPDYQAASETPSTRPAKSSTKPLYVRPAPPAQSPLEIDWITIGLGLLAVLAVGGLLPFFLWIYFMYNPPLP